MNDIQPGQVVIPHDSDEPQQPGVGAPQPVRPLEDPGTNPGPVPTSAPAPEATVSVTAAPVPVPAVSPPAVEPTQPSGWQFNQSADVPSTNGKMPVPEAMNWTASEFIAHEKGPLWYGALVAVGLAAATLDYVLTHDKISTAVIAFATIAFASFAARKPHTQEYALTHQALQIGVKSYDFKDFKNFSVIEEGAIASIVFMPLKRFMPPLTIYVAPDMENQVMNFLSDILPFEQHRADAVDSLMRRIRF